MMKSYTKLRIALSLNIAGNIWDNVSTQLNKIHIKGLVVFRNFSAELLHIKS